MMFKDSTQHLRFSGVQVYKYQPEKLDTDQRVKKTDELLKGMSNRLHTDMVELQEGPYVFKSPVKDFLVKTYVFYLRPSWWDKLWSWSKTAVNRPIHLLSYVVHDLDPKQSMTKIALLSLDKDERSIAGTLDKEAKRQGFPKGTSVDTNTCRRALVETQDDFKAIAERLRAHIKHAIDPIPYKKPSTPIFPHWYKSSPYSVLPPKVSAESPATP